MFKNPEAGCRCLVSLLDLYVEKLPPIPKTQDLFYCRSLQKYDPDKRAMVFKSTKGEALFK